jgi:hypothetical protein
MQNRAAAGTSPPHDGHEDISAMVRAIHGCAARRTDRLTPTYPRPRTAAAAGEWENRGDDDELPLYRGRLLLGCSLGIVESAHASRGLGALGVIPNQP